MAETHKLILFEAGFTQLLKDEGAFVEHTASGGWCVIGTHVDDLFPLYTTWKVEHSGIEFSKPWKSA